MRNVNNSRIAIHDRLFDINNQDSQLFSILSINRSFVVRLEDLQLINAHDVTHVRRSIAGRTKAVFVDSRQPVFGGSAPCVQGQGCRVTEAERGRLLLNLENPATETVFGDLRSEVVQG